MVGAFAAAESGLASVGRVVDRRVRRASVAVA